MIRPDGLVKVLDFGLAKLQEKEKRRRGEEEFFGESNSFSPSPLLPFSSSSFLTTPGLVMGTVAYMSPEQARGLPTDERTDVWSLGVCLSETVFGVQPFAGDTASDQIAAILKSEPEPQNTNAPAELCRIIEKCLEKNREDRYQTIGEFLSDLKKFERETEFSGADEFSFNQTKILSANGKPTGRNSFAPTNVSSAEYVVGEIKKHKFLAVASIIIVAALGSILYFAAFNRFSSAEPIRSIAVLPFAGEADDEYLADGLSETLIKKFEQIPQIKVASRNSAFQFKNKTADASEIARTLGVEAILKGRVARNGDDLEISVELIKAAENAAIWSETYKRKTADAQAIQKEIAQIILQKINIETSDASAQKFNAPITTNGQAYQLYLNGVFYRRSNGDRSIEKAIELQKQAIRLDPDFALAYVELAINQYNLVAIGVVDSETGLPPVREAVGKALTLAPHLAEAHNINARLKIAEFNWAGAENEFRLALAANPNLVEAHNSYSEYLSYIGRFDEALREIRRAQELDPLRTGFVGNEGIILFYARRYDEALKIFERDDPDKATSPYPHLVLARAYAAKNRYQEAIAALQKSLEILETSSALIHLGRAYALKGDRKKAIALLERLKKTENYVSPAETAILYDALGMRDEALANLERAFAEQDANLSTIKVAPEYDPLRDDPRFANLLNRINF